MVCAQGTVHPGSARASRAVVGALADHVYKRNFGEAPKYAREARALPGIALARMALKLQDRVTREHHPGMDSYSRRQFLKTVGQAGIFSALPSLVRAMDVPHPDRVCISILHTTDIHGHILPTIDYSGTPDMGGLARCVTQIRRWRRKNRNTILIDVGDVYQGTDVALRSKGQVMIDLFNHLRYDAWVVGNHEFDWGMKPFLNALEKSKMPVLAANASLEGRASGEIRDPNDPLRKVQPYIIKDRRNPYRHYRHYDPGMPFWFRPEFTQGFEVAYPVEPVRRAIRKAKGEGAHAIVLSGHMGLKARVGGGHFANNVMSLTSEFPEASVFIAGHTHQSIPSRLTNGVLFTQSDHYGIHVGRVDLVFDRNSRKLVSRHARCELMDSRFALDSRVISRAKPLLSESESALSQPIGDLPKPCAFAPIRMRPATSNGLSEPLSLNLCAKRNSG